MGKSIEPYQTDLAVTHLHYLMESQPQRLLKLYKERSLKSYLTTVVDRAEDTLESLQAAGLREDEALEFVNRDILCPPLAHDASLRALNDEEVKEIMESLCP